VSNPTITTRLQPSAQGCIALVANIPTPYSIAAWNHLARLTEDTLAVRFMAPSNGRRTWRVPMDEMEFDWQFLSHSNSGGLVAGITAGLRLLVFLMRRRPRAVICAGYDTFAAWVSLAWCRLFRRRLVLCLDSNARDRRPRSMVRAWLKRVFVSNAGAIAALGKAASQYARQLGAREEQIVVVPFGGDTKFFARESGKVDAAHEKQFLSWPPRLILYAGRLVPEKGVFVLLEAFRSISARHPETGLIFVGHGPAQKDMKEFCRRCALERVYFLEPQEYKRMPYFYALADLLVLPTLSDPYGYVVIEAFACGVPAIVSRVAGVCDDVIFEGETGFTVSPGKARELVEKICYLLDDHALRTRMRANCRRVARGYSPETCAEGLFATARSSLEHVFTHAQFAGKHA